MKAPSDLKGALPARSARPSPHPIPQAVCHRAMTHSVFDAETGCHNSTYSTASHGYAQIGWQIGPGRNAGTLAHRAAWTGVHGPIPPGMTVDHLCKNRQCVNVQHMRLLTNLENARRTSGRDWPVGVCAHGHENSFTIEINGKMTCSICQEGWKKRGVARVRVKRQATRETARSRSAPAVTL